MLFLQDYSYAHSVSSPCIVEDGTHSALLSKAGLYKHLWDAQVGNFLSNEKAGD